jgi:hypothetical protein
MVEPSGRIGDTEGEFSVCQFFENGQHEYVRHWCGAHEAIITFKAYCTSVGARIGTTVRVIVTDGGDSTNMEWKREEGITYAGDDERAKRILGLHKMGRRDHEHADDAERADAGDDAGRPDHSGR